MLPQPFKSRPNPQKSPNLVTLDEAETSFCLTEALQDESFGLDGVVDGGREVVVVATFQGRATRPASDSFPADFVSGDSGFGFRGRHREDDYVSLLLGQRVPTFGFVAPVADVDTPKINNDATR